MTHLTHAFTRDVNAGSANERLRLAQADTDTVHQSVCNVGLNILLHPIVRVAKALHCFILHP